MGGYVHLQDVLNHHNNCGAKNRGHGKNNKGGGANL